MSEAEVATKAPESDAQNQSTESPAPGDAPAQPGGPAMSEHCTTDRPTPPGEAPKGEMRKLGGVDVYLAKPDNYPSNPSRLLLLLTGGTGLKSNNNQIQADKFAEEGYVVVMPDLFEGDPAPNSSSTSFPTPDGQQSFLDSVKLKIGETAKSFLIDMWLARHTEEKVLPILKKVISACEGEFADAVGNGGGIYAVGYCFGGRYILLLASEIPEPVSGGSWTGASKPADEEAGEAGEGQKEQPKTNGPYIKAGALAHATLVSPQDFEHLKSPISLVCVENDPMFPDDVRAKGEETMTKANFEHEVKVYPGVPHGFGVFGDYEEANIKEAQATAFDQMLEWIDEH